MRVNDPQTETLMIGRCTNSLCFNYYRCRNFFRGNANWYCPMGDNIYLASEDDLKELYLTLNHEMLHSVLLKTIDHLACGCLDDTDVWFFISGERLYWR